MRKVFVAAPLCLILFFVSCTGPQVKYFTDLRFNHSSPWYPIAGTHEVSPELATGLDDYVFYYRADGRLEKIVNNFSFRKKKPSHPLTHIDGVKTLTFIYDGATEVRQFFNEKNEPVKNNKLVFKEKYTYGTDGKLVRLEFLDLDDKPMESGWIVARYEWTHGDNMVIERRFDLNNQPKSIAPYFLFGEITGLVADSKGRPSRTYNLDTNLKPAVGLGDICYYADVYDEENLFRSWEYHKVDDSFSVSQGYSYGKVGYDENGYAALEEYFDQEGNMSRSEKY